MSVDISSPGESFKHVASAQKIKRGSVYGYRIAKIDPKRQSSATAIREVIRSQWSGQEKEEYASADIDVSELYQPFIWMCMYLILRHLYQHWWVLVAAWNVPLVVIAFVYSWPARYFALLSIINLLVTVLVRNELVLLLLYTVLVPLGRCLPAKPKYYLYRYVNNIGGLHSGSAVAGIVWLSLYVPVYAVEVPLEGAAVAALVSACLLWLLLACMVLSALPPLRERLHNVFELLHRFAGWSAVAMLLVHVIVASPLTSLRSVVLTPHFALSLCIAVSVFYVWFLVWRCVPSVGMHHRYSTAMRITAGWPGCAGTAVRVSRNFLEWHPFGVALVAHEEANHRMTIMVARAGDWTGKLISDSEGKEQAPPLYVRLITAPGFMWMVRGYDRVLLVATGSGLAPQLSVLQSEACPEMHVLWVAKRHREIWPDALPVLESKAKTFKLYDTQESGRPDMARLIELHHERRNTQAVFVVSNKRATYNIMKELFYSGVPCFGAEFDS
eukprot:TRINITY_DN8902_c0_g1_i1.p1 TRINITY_DN8902_c0_g1~~TRINITY_DN8902_c0_g1_i1.p1  ORF type:complete len:499 (+),score=150.33 TRINITY_DN8902_c0_g1_i1:209-1705(+)